MKRIILFGIMFILLSPVSFFTIGTVRADSNSYYVSTTGNNANNGLSPATAWATLEYAMTKVSAGDTVYVMAGTYVHDYITSTKCGSAGNFITYIAYGNGEVILDATGSTSTWAGALWLTNVKYVRFSGFTIRDSSSFGMLFEVTTTSNNITIDNCTIYNCSSSGICFQGASGTKTIKDLLVENNTIYNCQNNWYGTRTQEVVTFSVCARFVFRNNYLYDGHIALVDIKNSCSEGYLYNNQIDTTGTYGFYIDARATNSNNLSFYNNIAWGSGTGYVLASEVGGDLADISFYNNIYNGTQNAFKIDRYTTAGTHDKINLKFINNVIASCSTAFKFLEDDEDVINLTVRNNIVKGTVGFNVPYIELQNHNVDHNLYNVQTSNYYGANSINGSPCFVDPSNGDFHLLSNSPAIDAGSSDNAPLVDFDGVSRPQGSAVDIGAFEFVYNETGNNPPNNPVTSNGPDTGNIGVSYHFSTSCTDPDGDFVRYGWDWDGDNNIDQWTNFYNSGQTISNSHSWGNASIYYIRVKSEDTYGEQSSFSNSKTIIISGENNPPNKPVTPNGPDTGNIGVSYHFSTSCTDPDGDFVRYGWDWDGDNFVDEWTNYYYSGLTISSVHKWGIQGEYNIRVKSEDIYGKQSSFTNAKTITINGNNNPPNVPDTPSGITQGDINQDYLFSTTTTDSDGDLVKYGWDWDGDNQVDEWTDFQQSGEIIEIYHIWGIPGIYNIKVKSEDTYGAKSNFSNSKTIIIVGENNPPDKPTRPIGITIGEINKEYFYQSKATDPDQDDLYYFFNWGDDTSTKWTGPYKSGTSVIYKHSWSEDGIYKISVKTKDIYGAESDNSDLLIVQISAPIQPQIEIKNITGRFLAITAVIENTGDYDLEDIEYFFNISGGLLPISARHFKARIHILQIGQQQTISSSAIFGLGDIQIIIEIRTSKGVITSEPINAFVFLPFVLIE